MARRGWEARGKAARTWHLHPGRFDARDCPGGVTLDFLGEKWPFKLAMWRVLRRWPRSGLDAEGEAQLGGRAAVGAGGPAQVSW